MRDARVWKSRIRRAHLEFGALSKNDAGKRPSGEQAAPIRAEKSLLFEHDGAQRALELDCTGGAIDEPSFTCGADRVIEPKLIERKFQAISIGALTLLRCLYS